MSNRARSLPLAALACLLASAVLPGVAWAEDAEASVSSEGEAEEADEGAPFTLGLATQFHSNMSVPDGKTGANVMLGGVFWRVELAEWAQIGGGLYAGADVGDLGEKLKSVRFELVSFRFEIPAGEWIRPSMRLGVGFQSESTVDRAFGINPAADSLPYTGDGIFFVGAPGVLFQPVEWLHMYLEFQSTVTQRGQPNDSSAVQLGGEFGIGITL
jgi:hypothetical protein